MQKTASTKFLLGQNIILTGKKEDVYFEHLIQDSELFEPDIVNLISTSVKQDSFVVDVGANIGYITLVMSILVPSGKVFSFEPAKDTYELLADNVSNNKLKNVVTRNAGLSDVATSAVISHAHDNLSGGFVSDAFAQSIKGHDSSKIRLVKLDDQYKKLGINKCDLIKVDIEGHELQFLRGAQKFIKAFKPLAIIEANHWCLNIFSRTSLPDFIDELYKSFPYIFAFDAGKFFDLSDADSKYRFYYENTVNNRFTNLYCGFDYNQLIANLCFGFSDSNPNLKQKEIEDMQQENRQLKVKLEKLESTKLYKTIRKMQRIKR